jgi:hypothetical protein
MTANIVLSQHDCIHVANDSAFYETPDRVDSFAPKAFPIASWPGVIVGTGIEGAPTLLSIKLPQAFRTFDELVEGAEFRLPQLVNDYQLPYASIILAGISAERGPEAYSFRTNDDYPTWIPEEKITASKYEGTRPCELVKLGALVMNPVPADQVQAANWQGVKSDAPLDDVLWSLRKLLEMQRHTVLPDDVGGIGGFGMVTSVYADRIEQRVIVEWPEDQIGVKLRPAAVDWDAWHRDNPRPTVTLPSGISRARRQMLERKARKRGIEVVK